MCELKFGHNKRVKYIKGLARGWSVLLEVVLCPGVVPEKWANYTLQINLRGFSGRYMTVARQKRNETCEREAKRYGIKRENDEKRKRERERYGHKLRSEKRDKRVGVRGLWRSPLYASANFVGQWKGLIWHS